MKESPEHHEYGEFVEKYTKAACKLFESIPNLRLAAWTLEDAGYFNQSPWSMALDSSTKNAAFIDHPKVKLIANQFWWTRNEPPKTSSSGESMSWRLALLEEIKSNKPGLGPQARSLLTNFFSIVFTISFSAYNPDMNSEWDYATDGYIFLMASGFVISELYQMREASRTGGIRTYFKTIFNYFDLTIVLAFSALIVCLSFSLDAFHVATGVAVLFLWLRLFQLLTFEPTFGPIIVSLQAMMHDVVNFVVLLLFFIMGFTFAFRQAVNGFEELVDPDQNYASTTSIFYLLILNFLGGNTDYSKMEEMACTNDSNNNGYGCNDTQANLGFFLVWMYLIMTGIVLINMLIAMMGSSFGAINDKKEEEASFLISGTKDSYIRPGILLPPPLTIFVLFGFLGQLFFGYCCIKCEDCKKDVEDPGIMELRRKRLKELDCMYCHHCQSQLKHLNARPDWGNYNILAPICQRRCLS